MTERKNIQIPHYLKGLLLSLSLILVAIPLLRWLGVTPLPLTDESPKPYILIFAHLNPILCLLLDWQNLKDRFLAIEQNDRLPLLALLIAQLLWFYSYWLSTAALIGYLVFVVLRFIFREWRIKCNGFTYKTVNKLRANLHSSLGGRWTRAKRVDGGGAGQHLTPTEGRPKAKREIGENKNSRREESLSAELGRRAKTIPIYIWCLVALFFLNAIGLLWQTQDIFPNITDRYVLYVLLPMSLLLYKPRLSSVYRYASFALPVVLSFLSTYLIYTAVYHLFYIEELYAWLLHPLSRVYQAKLTLYDTFRLFTDWLFVDHPSFILLALLPPFLIAFFSRKNEVVKNSELLAFTLLTFLFVGVTHLRYGTYYIILMTSLWLCKPYIGKIRKSLKRHFHIPLIIVGIVAGFIYQERELFTDNLRLQLYKDTIEQIKLFPLLGQGTGAESQLFLQGDGTLYPHTHNMFLSMSVNFGLLGLLWSLIFISSILHQGLYYNKSLLAFFGFMFPLLIIDSPFTSAIYINLMLTLSFLYSLTGSKNK